MAITFKSLCCIPHPSKKSLKSLNIFLGFFFILNYCLGLGYLGVPYAFLYSGFFAAVPTTILVAFVSWINANYLLEVMARAQALAHLDASRNSVGHDSSSESEADIQDLLNKRPSSPVRDHPKFELTQYRKFEIAELCAIFFHKYIHYIYMFILCLYGFLNNWSFATVAGSAWATNIPFRNFGSVEMCEEESFLHHTIPAEGCLYAYYFCLALFALIVVPLSLFDLREQAFIQIILGFMRFITLTSIIIYCMVRLGMHGDACKEQLQTFNTTLPINIEISSLFLRFDVKGWLMAIPVLTSAVIFQSGISSLTYPIDKKQYHHWLLLSVFVVAVFCYMSLGIVVPLWFRAATQETATLSWAVFAHRPGHSALRVYSYYIILFPSLDVISTYPLINHVISNNLYSLITGNDTSEKPKYRFDCLLRLFVRLIIAVLPILAAFGVSNLITVLKYVGLVGFMNFSFPVALQLRSIYVCKKEFNSKSPDNPASNGPVGPSDVESEQEEKKNTERSLLKTGKCKDDRKDSNNDDPALYMTPYSFKFLSHPIFVGIVALLGAFLFVLAFTSLFVQLDLLTCTELLEQLFLD